MRDGLTIDLSDLAATHVFAARLAGLSCEAVTLSRSGAISEPGRASWRGRPFEPLRVPR